MMKKEPNLTNLSGNAKDSGHTHEDIQIPLGFLPTSKQRLCGDIGMHIDCHGIWYYQGSPIDRKELVKLFSRVLWRDKGGHHWLITPQEIAPIRVDDAALVVVGMDVKGNGTQQVVCFRTNVDTIYELSKTYPLRIEVNPKTKEPAPYLILENRLEAKLSRSIFFDLVNFAVEDEIKSAHALGIWSGGTFHIIGDAVQG